jgi:hypothetical protein
MAIPGAALFCLLASLLPYLTTPFLLYLLFVAIYRLYFSPIAQIPGLKLGALTSLYEFYYDCVHFGQFHFQIQKLHKQYGMITPKQVPLSLPAFKAINITLSRPHLPHWRQRSPHRRPRILRSNLQCDQQTRQV